MTLSRSDVDHVALLARIGLSEEERVHLGGQLDAILEHVSQLQSIDTSHISPTAQVNNLVNAWRVDVAEPSLPRDRALANAPDRDGEFFTVGAIQE